MAMKGVNLVVRGRDMATPAFRSVQSGLRRTRGEMQKTQGLQRSWNAGLNSNRRAVQQLGFQMSDFAIQVSGGQSAMLAFTQQGGQMLQFFGPFGSILAALVAVFGSLAIAFTKSGKALSDLFPLMGVLQDDFRALGRVVNTVKEGLLDALNLIVNHLDVLLISAGVVASFFATKWVLSMANAASAAIATNAGLVLVNGTLTTQAVLINTTMIATYSLVTAFKVLRASLLRLGLPALVIAAGYLIERFLALKSAVGGWGEALGMVADVAREAFGRIGDGVQVVVLKVRSMVNSIKAAWFEGLAVMQERWAKFLRSISSAALNIPGMEGLGNKLAFDAAMAGQSVDQLRKVSDEFEFYASNLSDQADILGDKLMSPLQALQKIRDLIKDDKIDVRDWFGGKEAEDEAGKSTDKIAKKFEDMQKSISDSLMSAFNGLRKGTMSLGDAVNSILGNIMDKIVNLMLSPIFDAFAGGVTSLIYKGLGVPAPAGAPSFAGGGSTGNGPRAGGVDGMGGRMAVVHPKESINDHTRGGGGGTQVNVYNNTQGEARVERSQGPDGREMINVVVEESMARGRFDGAQRARFGNQPSTVKR